MQKVKIMFAANRKLWMLAWLVGCLPGMLYAQGLGSDLFNLGNNPGLLNTRSAPKPEVQAQLERTERPGVIRLEVTVKIPAGGTTYSQDPAGERPTKIELTGASGWTPLGQGFTETPKPKRAFDEIYQKELEKHKGTVSFSRDLLAPQGENLKEATTKGVVDLLVCDDQLCTPHKLEFTATMASPEESPTAPAATVGSSTAGQPDLTAPAIPSLSDDWFENPKIPVVPFPGDSSAGSITSGGDPSEADAAAQAAGLPPMKYAYQLTPERGAPGRTTKDPITLRFEMLPESAGVNDVVTVSITMKLAKNWSTYGLEAADESQIEIPTSITVAESGLEPLHAWRSSPEPTVVTTEIFGESQRTNAHIDHVTWFREYRVLDPDSYGIEGNIRYQICEKNKTCLMPHTVAFSLGEVQQTAHLTGATPVTKLAATADIGSEPSGADEPSLGLTADELVEGDQAMTLQLAVLSAFLAGLIMNVLPCVLPVLAIKILSLVQQAGESRARIIALNSAYAAGVLAVFFAFAIFAWGLGQSIGGIFQSNVFMSVMACVVFTMGLSLFGVFELPVPGIIPSAGHHQEGYLGAFTTGIVATVLGTPCIGPFVVSFLPWTLTQPAYVVFTVFGAMGIGMASPFMLSGIFPGLVNWLPKPGMWMVHFKQFTGFVLMGTTIWVLYATEEAWRIPMMIVMLAIALFVWMSSNFTSHNQPFRRKLATTAFALIAAMPVALGGLWMLQRATTPSEMQWVKFSEEKLIELRQDGKPMLIDFTADWCVICKLNELNALDREETVEFVKEHGFTPMMADFSRGSDEILKWLKTFGQESVPLTVIVPPGKDSEIIFLRGGYSKKELLAKLEESIQAGAPATEQIAEEPQSADPQMTNIAPETTPREIENAVQTAQGASASRVSLFGE